MLAGGFHLLLALFLVTTTRTSAAAPADAPIPWRNTGAATAGAGLPRALGAELPAPGVSRVLLLTEIASQYTQDTRGGEDVVLDVETDTALLAVERGLAPGWSARLELPWVRQGGGFLDAVINDYHDAFGFPDGGRSRATNGNVLLRWRDGGRTPFALDAPRSGLGDLRMGLARSLLATPDRSLAVRLGVELPTGDARDFTGNGALDGSVSLHLTDRAALARWGLVTHLSGGVLLIGDDEVTGAAARRVAGFASWTLARPLGARWMLKGQLDGHTATADSALRQVGGWSVQGSLGAAVRLSGGAVVEAGFTEDLRPGSAPDITFRLLLRAQVGAGP